MMEPDLNPPVFPRVLGIVVLAGVMLTGAELMPPLQAAVALVLAGGVIGTAVIWINETDRKEGGG